MVQTIELEEVVIYITELKRKTEPKPLECNYWKFTIKNISNHEISSVVFHFKSLQKEITKHKYTRSTVNLEPNEIVELSVVPNSKKYIEILQSIYIEKNNYPAKVYDQNVILGKRKEIIPLWYSAIWYTIYIAIFFYLCKYFFS
ncbi:hypothetical protein [Kordia jejudonensis]|uniref:hypothetical protein n=1 Tax=Kordia jejudonensis TaxID=1348245 RepID=UPI0012E034EF|nr:hypothetical protein [Kordia jejudonensis]